LRALEAIGVAAGMEEDPGVGHGEAARDGAADAGRGSGDQDDHARMKKGPHAGVTGMRASSETVNG